MRRIDPIDAQLGKLLRLARTACGISQEQLGSMNDLTFQQIQKYEHGQNRISVSRLIRMAEHMNISAMWFIEKLGTKEKEQTPTINLELLSKHESQEILNTYVKIEDKNQRQFLRLITKLLATQAKGSEDE